MQDGILIINKTKGLTSNEIIQKIKKLLEIKKIGHCGTLDPLATGLLLTCINKATKLSKNLINLEKEYLVKCKIGIKTYSEDTESKIKKIIKNLNFKKNELKEAIKKINKKKKQKPPMLSAIKFKGVPLYKYAKKKIKIKLKKRDIKIYKIKIIKKTKYSLSLIIKCSKGTYIRSIIRDINIIINNSICITSIHRVSSNHYNIKNSIKLSTLEKNKNLLKLTMK